MKSPKNRILLLSCIIGLLFSVFSWRLIDVQMLQHEKMKELAAANHMDRIPISARRGSILDMHGEVLADNVPAKKIVADCSLINDVETTVAVLSEMLELPATEVRARLTSGKRYTVIKRQVVETLASELRDRLAQLRLHGIHEEEDSMRVYPDGSLLCHAIGFVDHDFKGIQGIESTMDQYLRGEDGYRFIEKNRRGTELAAYRGLEVAPKHGATVRLTVDMGLQQIVETELDAAFEEYKPRSAVVVIIRPATGEVLAMATRPNFDINLRNKADQETKKNRAIIDMVEPGSTFKIVTVGAALNEKIVKPDTSIFCENGRFIWGGKPLKDHHPYGMLTVHNIIVKSSNIGVAKLAIQLGEGRVYEYIRRFGFGQKTGIELPGEISGTVHPPSKWSKISITHVPMGHEVCVTPLQLAAAFAAIGNDGVLMKPYIVQSITSADGELIKSFAPERQREIISREAATQLKAALISVVAPGGTAPQAKVDFYKVAGKTGTAQRVDPKGGYTPGSYVVSFAGFLPANNPEMAAVVILDDATTKPGMNYGGLVAAPIFSRIAGKAARYMDLPPSAEPVNPTPALAGVDLHD